MRTRRGRRGRGGGGGPDSGGGGYNNGGGPNSQGPQGPQGGNGATFAPSGPNNGQGHGSANGHPSNHGPSNHGPANHGPSNNGPSYNNGGGHGQQNQGRFGDNRQPPPLVNIEGFNPNAPVVVPGRAFEDLTSIDPQPRLTLEYPGCPDSCRLIDLFCPIGRGQRALIVSPPKAGKTTLLKDIATALARNHDDLTIIGLLVDERPEEVTDFRRCFAALGKHADGSPRAQVVASSNDHGVDRHIAISTGTIDVCRRMVLAGKHVVIVLDSLTRLGRAFNNSRRHASSGRTLTGGIDAKALEVPRQIFGSARNTEEAGSLTIVATCLVDTGSAMDQVIFEEFKGSGNMELILDRKIAERRLFPAINLAASGTRKENFLMGEAELRTVTALRRRLLATQPHVQVEQLLAALKRFPDNATLVGAAG